MHISSPQLVAPPVCSVSSRCVFALLVCPARFLRPRPYASRRPTRRAGCTSHVRQDDYRFHLALKGSSLITKSIPLSFPTLVLFRSTAHNRRFIRTNPELVSGA